VRAGYAVAIITVDFNYELGAGAEEVEDVLIHRVLLPKMSSEHLRTSQALPKLTLRCRLLAAQLPCTPLHREGRSPVWLRAIQHTFFIVYSIHDCLVDNPLSDSPPSARAADRGEDPGSSV